MNKVCIIGNLTRDPELRRTADGTPVCAFTLAVNRRYKSADGKQPVDFLSVTVWKALGEHCAKYLKKGSKAAVAGSIQTRRYEATDGTSRTAVDIVADEVQFLSTTQHGETASTVTHRNESQGGFTQVDDDELPF